MAYKEEEYLPLSGLQHFQFCRRRWALIHIEHQWADNFHTIDGTIMHEKAHDEAYTETRGNLVITRGMHVFSSQMGISGACDVLEFHRDEKGVPLKGRQGLWRPFPVEYKRGKWNDRSGDSLQLCAQALCLEEMLCCKIDAGALYYGETRRRVNVILDEALRTRVQNALAEMHALFGRGHTPKVKPSTSCNACSMKELCLPKLMHKKSASTYLAGALGEEL